MVRLDTVHKDTIGEVVRHDIIFSRHLVVVLPGDVHPIALHAGVQQRVEADSVGHDAHRLHFLEEGQSILKPLLPSATLDQSVIGDLVKLDAAIVLHLLQELVGPLKVTRVDAGVHQAVVDDLIRTACLLVLVKQLERLHEIHPILRTLQPVDQCRIGEIVRLNRRVPLLHRVEHLPCL